MTWFRSWVVVSACALLNGAACNLVSHSCTEAGCVGGVSVRLLAPGGVWQDGAYTLDLMLDARAGSCDFAIPADLPVTRGSATFLNCGEGITATLQQLVECTETRQGDAVSQSCQPIAGQYELAISAFEEPRNFGLTLSRDDTLLITESRALGYTENRPNGPDCEPVCREARLELTFEE